MATGSFGFDRYVLDTRNRLLRRDGEAVDLGGRYFDALALLVGAPGALVTKDRFHDEVWRGVPVTDEALTQCIRTLRRLLGDEAARPRFIETVPKHGYRFLAPVTALGEDAASIQADEAPRRGWRDVALLGAAGTIGGGLAGLAGGLVFGFLAASPPLPPGAGALSVLLVIWCLTIAIAVTGAAGVSFGIALAGRLAGGWAGSMAGGALGGMIVGGAVKLLGLDAFNLILGHAPAGITGAPEGMVLGAAVGLGAWLASRTPKLRQAIARAGLAGGLGGLAVTALGGRMMAGSLDLLARTFPDSQLRLDRAGTLFGEQSGPVGQWVTGALEGALFGACIVGAIVIARRGLGDRDQSV